MIALNLGCFGGFLRGYIYYPRGVTIRFLKNRSFEILRPRLGYWIEIIPLRYFENENISFAVAAHDLNGVLSSRQSFLLSEEFNTKSDAELSWHSGFRVLNYCEHYHVEQLIVELVASKLAFVICEDKIDLLL